MSRIEDLAADAALFGLDTDEAVELERLAAEAPSLREELELVAARLTVHGASGPTEALPASLRAKVQARAFEHFEGIVVAPPPTATTTGVNIVELAPVAARRRRSTTALLFAAAACLVAGVGVSTFLSRPVGQSAPAVDEPPAVPQPLVAKRGTLSAELHEAPGGTREVVTVGLEGEGYALYLLVEDAAGSRRWSVGPELEDQAGGVRVATLEPALVVHGFAVAARGLDPTERSLENAPLRAVRGEGSSGAGR